MNRRNLLIMMGVLPVISLADILPDTIPSIEYNKIIVLNITIPSRTKCYFAIYKSFEKIKSSTDLYGSLVVGKHYCKNRIRMKSIPLDQNTIVKIISNEEYLQYIKLKSDAYLECGDYSTNTEIQNRLIKSRKYNTELVTKYFGEGDLRLLFKKEII